jgi:hypothetical protein
MRFPKDKKNAYINGYNKLSDQDYSILYGGQPVEWKSDWEIDGKKKVDKETIIGKTDIPTPGGATHFNMYTDVDNLFKYSKNIKNIFEDPTYLGFSIKIDSNTSPLFNYGGSNKYACVGTFIEKYSLIPDIADRLEIYTEFVNRIFELFQSDFTNNQFVRSYYIQSISGLDKFNSKMVKYGEDKLSIMLTEDISLRSTYLAELYNNLCYSYKEQRYMIPENLLRFDMIIEVTDIRIFRLYNDDAKRLGISNKTSESFINTDPPRIIYTLHDCNFDFFNSIPFEGAMTISGTEGTSNKPAVFTFDIKYKSISKEFRSNIIDKNVLTINNKLNDIVKKNNDLTGEKVNFFKNDIYSEEFQLEKVKKMEASKTDKLISNYRDKIVGKINQERGKLINKVLDSITKPTKLSKITPDNVYDENFRKLTVENFAKNLGSNLLNNLEDAARNTMLGITKPPF